jgi:hypothetical protein
MRYSVDRRSCGTDLATLVSFRSQGARKTLLQHARHATAARHAYSQQTGGWIFGLTYQSIQAP